MMLVADSGATKTDWRWIDKEGNISSFSSAGLNPLFWTPSEMTTEIRKKIPEKVISQIALLKSPIYFYGASCSSKERTKIVQSALKMVFPKSKAEINNDMLACARALCGNKAGIACILGTGSNSCYYDGKKILQSIGGLTYILGDEGSGAHIGMAFIKAFLNQELPEKIHTIFRKEYRLTKNKIWDALYRKKHPNRFLASFAKFVRQHIREPFLDNLVKQCITEFFDKTICKYENHTNIPIGFAGSIAHNFRDILYRVAQEKRVVIHRIHNSPIDELVKYHLTALTL